MGITLVTSGKQFSLNLKGAAAPSGVTEAIISDGAITWQEGTGVAILNQDGATYLVRDAALPADKVFIMRAKARLNSAPAPDMVLTYVDDDTQPSAEMGTRGPVIDSYSTGVSYVEWANGPYTALNASTSIGVDYIWELESDGTNLTARIRDGATLAEIGFETKAWGSAEAPSPVDSLWPVLGSTGVSLWGIDLTAAWWEAFDSFSITVTGLSTGNAVRLYDAADTVLASAVESGGTAILDVETVDMGLFSGYLKVFEDDTYAAELARYPESGNDSDIRGGAEAAFSLTPPTVTSITPSSGLNDTTVAITDLAGTDFRSGAVVKLRKTGQTDIAATGVTVVSATKITCTFNLAGAAAGAWDVYVENTDATSDTLEAAFTVSEPVPAITSVLPLRPYVGDGITIAGTEFGATQGSSAVTVNGVAVTEYTSWSDTAIVARVPAGATSGNVVVTRA